MRRSLHLECVKLRFGFDLFNIMWRRGDCQYKKPEERRGLSQKVITTREASALFSTALTFLYQIVPDTLLPASVDELWLDWPN